MRKSLGESNTFVGHVWFKLRGDAHHQLEEVQDWAAHLERLQSILLELDANNALGEGQLGRTFADGLRPLIKLWITNIGEDMPWDDLIRAANKAEARAKIQGSTHLDQQCLKGKRPLKMSLNARDDQATAPQPRPHSSPAGQSKAPGGARRERKRTRQGRRGHREASPAKSQEDASEIYTFENDTSEADASQAGEAQKEAQQEAPKRRRQNGPIKRNASKVTCYNCNKKGHYAKYCTEPKN